MKSFLRFFLSLLLALASAAFAAGGAPIPPLKARVTDLTGTLSAAQAQSLESRLRDFEQRKGSQIAVLILSSTGPEEIEQYSIRVAEAWKIGRKNVDDGAILVIAKDDHRVRIEVGRGLEGAIPDVIASRVIREIIAPRFLAGDFYGGIVGGTEALMKLIDGEPLPQVAQRRAVNGDLLVWCFVALVFVSAIVGRLLGRVLGAAVGGGVVGAIVWVVVGTLGFAVLAGLAGFFLSLLFGGARSYGRGYGGPWMGGGGFGGGGFGGGGGFSGGGGSFGGGGASGRW